MHNIPPNMSAKSYTISAFVIGYLLIDDLNPAEQNSVGNWFMLLAQVLCTNSAQQQVLNNRKNVKDTGDHVINSDDTLSAIRRSVDAMAKYL